MSLIVRSPLQAAADKVHLHLKKFDRNNVKSHQEIIYEAFIAIQCAGRAEAENKEIIKTISTDVDKIITKTLKNGSWFAREKEKIQTDESIQALLRTYALFKLCVEPDAVPSVLEEKLKQTVKKSGSRLGVTNYFKIALAAKNISELEFNLTSKFSHIHHPVFVAKFSILCHKLEGCVTELSEKGKISRTKFEALMDAFTPGMAFQSLFDDVRKESRAILETLFPLVDSAEKITTLNLQRWGLEEVPRGIVYFSGLRLVKLDDNNIRIIPPELSSLKELKILSLQRNKIEEFPLSDFSGLSSLNLACNLLKDTLQVSTVCSLTTLDLSGNGLTCFPGDVLKLSKLERLNLSFNRISVLPESLKHSKLMLLDLSCNQLTAISSVTGLKNLNHLVFSFNPDLCLPDLNDMYLQELHCTRCGLTELFELREGSPLASSLDTLNVANNKLAEIPESWCHLKSIRNLFAQDNALRTIPSTFNSKSWESLILKDNQLEKIGAFIYGIPIVWLCSNAIRQLPAVEKTNENLTYVWNLADNRLSEVTSDFLNKINFQFLNLAFNPIVQLPSLLALGSLSHLDISYTRLSAEEQNKYAMSIAQLHEQSLQSNATYIDCQDAIQYKKFVEMSIIKAAKAGLESLIRQSEDDRVPFDKAQALRFNTVLAGPIVITNEKPQVQKSTLQWKSEWIADSQHAAIYCTQTNGNQKYQQDGYVFAEKDQALQSPDILEKVFKAMDKTLSDPNAKTQDEFVVGSGAMAAAAVFHKGDCYISNVGDAEVLAIDRHIIETALDGFEAMVYTTDHFVRTPPQIWANDRNRLYALAEQGGSVSIHNDFELRGDMLPTYSVIGDIDQKHVPCEPSPVIHLKTSEFPLILMATDGLLDQISSEDAIKIVYDTIVSSGTRREDRKKALYAALAKAMDVLRDKAFSKAYTLTTKSDNITLGMYWAKKEVPGSQLFMVIDGHDRQKLEKFVPFVLKKAKKAFIEH